MANTISTTFPEPLLTPEQLAAWLQIRVERIYESRHEGVFPGNLALKVGRRLRFDPAEIRRHLAGNRDALATVT